MSTNSNSDSEVTTAPRVSRSRAKSLLVNLGLSAGSLLFFAAMLEVLLRFMGYGNVEIYQPDPALYWTLKPNQDCYTKVNRQPVHINSRGTRGPEFGPVKAAGALRIVSLGDSRTFGWGVSDDQTYSAVLGKLLQGTLNRPVEVINAGVNAWSFPQMTAYFRDRALRYNPDFVVLGDANFWTQFSEHNSPEFTRQFARRVQLKNFLRRFALFHYFVEVQLSGVYRQYRLKFMPVDPAQDTLFKAQQQQDASAVFREAIERLCTIAISNKVVPILIYLPIANDLNATMQSKLRQSKAELSQRFHIPFLDLSADFAPAGKSLYLEGDPVHFTAEGHQIVAQRLFQTLTNLVSVSK